MLSIKPRPFLCWHTRDSQESWEGSHANYSWRPSGHHYPDTKRLLPGDIVLFQPIHPNPIQAAIQAFQTSPFTHAALYIRDDHQLCEASPIAGKVIFASLEDKLPGSCILVRRVPDVGEDGQREIAKMADELIGNPYAFSTIAVMALKRVTGLKLPNAISTSNRQAFICSTLCEHAILAATKGKSILRRTIDDVITPADLAATDILEDVDVTWKQAVIR